jgi:hypothetical protein
MNSIGPSVDSDASAPITIDATSPQVVMDAPNSPTISSDLTYAVVFSEAVSGLAASDFSVSGTAAGCTVGTPSGSGASYTVGVSSCGNGTVVLTLTANSVADVAGNNGPPTPATTSAVILDTIAPTISTPVASANVNSTIGSIASVRIAWSGSDAGSGVALYEVWLSTNAGSFVKVASPTTTSYTRSMTTSATTTYRFGVRAYDTAGNVSGFAYGPTFHVKLIQQSSSAVHYHGTWYASSSSSASGGSYRYTSTAGRYASYTFTGRTIAVVAKKGSAFGSFKVYLDGVYKATVSEHATSNQWRRIVYSLNVSPGTHRIKLVCSGTSGHPRIGLDAFLVLG